MTRLATKGRASLLAAMAVWCTPWIALWSAAPAEAAARPGFYVGGGAALQSVSGDLDGKKAFVNSSLTTAYLVGKLDTGYGPELVVGYGFNKLIAVETVIAYTAHTATHRSVPFDSDAAVLNQFAGARLSYEVIPQLEVFGRAGLANVGVFYSDYAVHGDVTTGTYNRTRAMQLRGGGFTLGGGAEWTYKKVAISGSYTYSDVTFTSLSAGGSSVSLSRELSAAIQQISALVTYHFK